MHYGLAADGSQFNIIIIKLEVLIEHMHTPCSPACGLDIAIYGHFRINSYVLAVYMLCRGNATMHACI